MSEQFQTFKALDAAQKNGLHISDFQLSKDRYVIFSDAHKGNGSSDLDDFQQNEHLYCQTLKHYLDNDYRLVLNGDMEECWKTPLSEIMETYESTAFEIERQFAARGPRFYMRTYGNHDDDWANPRKVDKYLNPILRQQIKVYPSIRLGSRIMIAHGHQGDLTSDRLARLSRRVVHRFWKPLQQLLKVKMPGKVAGNNHIHSNRDRYLHQWAVNKRQVLIAGHTHRALFNPYPKADSTDHYINVGCCVLLDGMTGIEIDQGEIRLVKWAMNDSSSHIERSVFATTDLAALIARL
jgi:UDP-2,3-diacylglucosamine pyrophosphatase LpxH